MSKREKMEPGSLPPCPNPTCSQPRVVRNGSHRGRQRSQCRTCKRYFGETQGTPMSALKTPAAEVAHALVIVMRRGSVRAAEEITGHTYETISVWLKRAADHAAALTEILAQNLHLSQVDIDAFWSCVRQKREHLSTQTKESTGAAWSKTATVASWSPAPLARCVRS